MAGNDNQKKYGLVEICKFNQQRTFFGLMKLAFCLSNGKRDTSKWYYWLDTSDIFGLSCINFQDCSAGHPKCF